MARPSLDEIFAQAPQAAGPRPSLDEIFGAPAAPAFGTKEYFQTGAGKAIREKIEKRNAAQKDTGPTVGEWAEAGKGVLRRAAQGATFGLADEAEAALRASNDPRGPQTYNEHLERIRSENELEKQQQGTAGEALEIGSSLLVPGLGAAKIAQGAAKVGERVLAKQLAKGVTEEAAKKTAGRAAFGTNVLGQSGASAAQSALGGFGGAEGGFENRARSATESGIRGLVGGAVVPVLGGAGSKLIKIAEESPVAASLGNLLGKESVVGQKVRQLEHFLQKVPLVGTALTGREKRSINDTIKLISSGEKTKRMEEIGSDVENALTKSMTKATKEVSDTYKKSDDILKNKLGIELKPEESAEDYVMAGTAKSSSKLDELMNRPGVLAPEKRALQKVKDELESTPQHTAGSLKRAKSLMYDAMDNDKKLLDPRIKKEVYDAMKEDRYDAIRATAGDKGEEAVSYVKAGEKLHKDKLGKLEEDEDLYDLVEGKPAKVAAKIVGGLESGRKGDTALVKKVLDIMEPDDREKFLNRVGIAKLLPAEKGWDDIKAKDISDAFKRMGESGSISKEQRLIYGPKTEKIARATDVMENIGSKDVTSGGMLAAGSQLAAMGGLGTLVSPFIFGGSDAAKETAGTALGSGAGLGTAGVALALALSRPGAFGKMIGGGKTSQAVLQSIIPGLASSGGPDEETRNRRIAQAIAEQNMRGAK